MGVKCFLIRPNGLWRATILALEETEKVGFPCASGHLWHRLEKEVGQGSEEHCKSLMEQSGYRFGSKISGDCTGCGRFIESKVDGSSMAQQWERADDPSVKGWDVRTFGPGAMYYATWEDTWNQHEWSNFEGSALHVILPNGREWNIDSRASNCTMREDKLHRCWVRHGEVPNITVDKNGVTCQAGAGSIMAGDYHGFLRNGELTN